MQLGRMPMYTTCSSESLEAVCKDSNFKMFSTYPLILYLLNLNSEKRKEYNTYALNLS